MGRTTVASLAAELAAQRAELAALRSEIEWLRSGAAGEAAAHGDRISDATDATSADRGVTRRSVMLAAVGAAAGLAAAAVRAAPANAATGGSFILGQTNTAAATTTLDSASGLALHGKSSAAGGNAIRGSATATTGQSRGVFGESSSPTGVGVYGSCPSGSDVSRGVWGYVNSANGFALYGSGALKVTGRAYLGAPASAPASAVLSNGSISFYLDQTLNRLKIRVKYSNGTLKTASIALV